MDERIVGDIFVDYSASQGLHRIYVKCTYPIGSLNKVANIVHYKINFIPNHWHDSVTILQPSTYTTVLNAI